VATKKARRTGSGKTRVSKRTSSSSESSEASSTESSAAAYESTNVASPSDSSETSTSSTALDSGSSGTTKKGRRAGRKARVSASSSSESTFASLSQDVSELSTESATSDQDSLAEEGSTVVVHRRVRGGRRGARRVSVESGSSSSAERIIYSGSTRSEQVEVARAAPAAEDIDSVISEIDVAHNKVARPEKRVRVLRVVRRIRRSRRFSRSGASIRRRITSRVIRAIRLSRSWRAADKSVRAIVKGFDFKPVSVVASGLRSIKRSLTAAREKCLTKSSLKNSNLERLFGSSTNLLRGVKKLEESPIVDEETSDVAATVSAIGNERITRSRLLKHINRVYTLLRRRVKATEDPIDHAELHAEATGIAAAASDLKSERLRDLPSHSERELRDSPSQNELDLHDMLLHSVSY
jgi:hypothetical protein